MKLIIQKSNKYSRHYSAKMSLPLVPFDVIITRTITSCSSRHCRVEGSSENGLYKTCSNAFIARDYLTIKTIVLTNSGIRQLKHHIVYTCQFDICNEQSIFLKARNITYTYYNVTPILRMFNENPTIEPTSAALITQFSSASASLQSSFISIAIKSNSTIVSTQPNSLPVIIQSITEISSTGDQLRVSITLLSFIFPIYALSCLKNYSLDYSMNLISFNEIKITERKTFLLLSCLQIQFKNLA